MGDEIKVKVIDIDNMGKIKLSRRAVLENLSQLSEDKATDSLSENYPFKKQSTVRPPYPHHPRG